MANILVVDDNKDLRLLYEEELSSAGHTVTLAANGPEALEQVKAHRPDVVVLDISMPGMDGIELLGKILAYDKTILVVLNTAFSAYKDNFMTWCADAYVVKSGDVGELIGKIEGLLEARRKIYPLALPCSNRRAAFASGST